MATLICQMPVDEWLSWTLGCRDAVQLDGGGSYTPQPYAKPPRGRHAGRCRGGVFSLSVLTQQPGWWLFAHSLSPDCCSSVTPNFFRP